MSKSGLRWNSRKDGNQTAIVESLRRLGYDVDIVHRLKGLYDLVVSGRPTWHNWDVAVRVEIKMPGAGLSPDEADYWARQNHAGNLIVAETVEDVLRWFGR